MVEQEKDIAIRKEQVELQLQQRNEMREFQVDAATIAWSFADQKRVRRTWLFSSTGTWSP